MTQQNEANGSRRRKVICPTCGHDCDYPSVVGLGNRPDVGGGDVAFGVANEGAVTCRVCKESLELAANDFQDVVFCGMDDGYHSWYSQPTSYHTRYRCANYGVACAGCVHAPDSDMFCFEGRVDIRRRRRQRYDGSVYLEYKGWIEEW